MTNQYPFYTPYSFAGNSPIENVDLDGAEPFSIKAYKMNSPLTRMMKANEPLGNALKVRMSATKAGVISSVSNTYNFFTRDAYKAQTWQNFGHLMDEVLLSSSGQSYIYNPNTPMLDAKVKEFKDVGLNGNAFQRYKYWSELATDVATAEISSKGFGALKETAVIGLRTSLAASFYEKVGFSLEKAGSHMEGIDFSKPVQTITLKKGTVVQQWVGEHGVGNYFTPVENGAAHNLGISYEGRELKSFTLTDDVKVLRSTAADYKGNAGGGTQYFSPEVKGKVTPNQ